jgi:acyl carrier protein
MGLDSVELLFEIENAFNIKIPGNEAKQISTVRDFYEVVWRHLKEQQTTHSRQEVELLINKIIADRIGLAEEEVISTARLTDDLGID